MERVGVFLGPPWSRSSRCNAYVGGVGVFWEFPREAETSLYCVGARLAVLRVGVFWASRGADLVAVMHSWVVLGSFGNSFGKLKRRCTAWVRGWLCYRCTLGEEILSLYCGHGLPPGSVGNPL